MEDGEAGDGEAGDGEEGEDEEREFEEELLANAPASAGARLHLSPVRLRMGWRRNGELELRTSELQHMLEVLKLPGGTPKDGAPRVGSPAMGRHAIDATVRRFEAMQQKLEALEREMESVNEGKRQAIASRAEMVKRFEEEKKRADGLDAQLRESGSKLARAQRQLYLLRNPSGDPQPEEGIVEDPDKPKPLHMRLKEEEQKRTEKRQAMQQQMEQGRTYAPKIDPTSASIQREKKVEPVKESKAPAGVPLDATDMAVLSFKGKASEGKAAADLAKAAAAAEVSTSASAPLSSAEISSLRATGEATAFGDGQPADDAKMSQLLSTIDATNAELAREKKARETVEAQLARSTLAETNAVSRREEVELMMQRMASKERDMTAEVDVARRQAKEARGELDFAKKLAEAAQMDAATKADETRILTRERMSWESERAKSRARTEEAEILAKELTARVKVAEAALDEIGNAPPPADGAVKAQRKGRGIQDHPNAEAVQKQQQKAKVEKAKLEAEQAKAQAQKVVRELQRAVEEQKRLQSELETAMANQPVDGGGGAPGQGGGARAATPAAADGSAPAAENPKAMLKRTNTSGSDQGKSGRGKNGKKDGGLAAMQDLLRGEVEEATLVKELGGVEDELHAAKALAHTSSATLNEEKQARVRAESSLERFTRITALQHAAQEALNATLRHDHELEAEDELFKSLGDVSKLRVGSFGGLDSARSPRSNSPRSAVEGVEGSFSARGLGSARGSSLSARQGAASPRAPSPRANSPRAASPRSRSSSSFAPPALQSLAAPPAAAPAMAWAAPASAPAPAPSS